MDLCDREVISGLMAECQKARKNVTRRDSPDRSSAVFYPRRKRSMCKCGQCKMCIENARWDRIFNEKFADPNYYAPHPYHFGSSLGWLR